jgi:hypothetical protein
MIVPGGGISLDGTRWVPCRPDFILPVEVLSRLFRGRFLAKLVAAHRDGHLKFFGVHARLDNIRAFKAYLAPLRKIEWVVYAKRPFGGPRAVLAYLSRYTHRVAISNRRLLAADDGGVSFRWKDYRIEGPGRWKTMTLTPHEFIRRFLMHVLPAGFHRIRHYGLLASGTRAANIARARELLAVPVSSEPPDTPAAEQARMLPHPCPCCGGRMFIIETFARGCEAPSHPGVSRDQDRHLMMPSSPIHHRADARHSGRFSPGSTPACVGPQDWPVVAPQIRSRNAQPARSRPRGHPLFQPNRARRPPRSNPATTHAAAKSP